MGEAQMSEAGALAPARRQTVDAMRIAGLGGTYSAATVPDIPLLWQRFAPQIGSIPGMVGSETYGVVSAMGGDEDQFHYLAGVRVADGTGLPDAYEQISIPAQTYVVFVHSGPVAKLPETCHAIWHEWLPSSPHRTTGTPDFLEVYGDRFDPESGSGEVEVWVPIAT